MARAKQKAAAESAAPAVETPPVVSHATEHRFTFGASRYEACSCGLERDTVLREGNAVRLFRSSVSEAWNESAPPCPNAPKPAEAPVAPKETPKSGAVCSLESALTKAFPEAFAPEIVNGCDVDKTAKEVMLDVAFSPVLPSRTAFTPCDVGPLDGDRWRVYLPAVDEYAHHRVQTMDVSASDLRVMRARYLLKRGEFYRAQASPQWGALDWRRREQIVGLYHLTPLPAEGSALRAVTMTGEPLSIPLAEGQNPLAVLGALMREAYPEESGPQEEASRG